MVHKFLVIYENKREPDEIYPISCLVFNSTSQFFSAIVVEAFGILISSLILNLHFFLPRVCPVCNSKALYDNLRIDGYFQVCHSLLDRRPLTSFSPLLF